MSRPPEPGERLRFGQPTFAAPRRRRASTPAPAAVATPTELDRLAARRAANLPDPGDDVSALGVARVDRLASRRAANDPPAPAELAAAPPEETP